MPLFGRIPPPGSVPLGSFASGRHAPTPNSVHVGNSHRFAGLISPVARMSKVHHPVRSGVNVHLSSARPLAVPLRRPHVHINRSVPYGGVYLGGYSHSNDYGFIHTNCGKGAVMLYCAALIVAAICIVCIFFDIVLTIVCAALAVCLLAMAIGFTISGVQTSKQSSLQANNQSNQNGQANNVNRDDNGNAQRVDGNGEGAQNNLPNADGSGILPSTLVAEAAVDGAPVGAPSK